MKTMGDPAAMSVVLVTDTYPSIRAVIERFQRQTVRKRLEVVMVIPSAEAPGTEEALRAGFGAVRIVPVDSIVPLAKARAKGVRAATAPLVFIGETHSYPHPRMAESLIEAHASPCAVVVPAFLNANPDGPLSWAAFLSDYGVWVDGLPAQDLGTVPTYNAAFRRAFLLGFEERLELALSQGEEMRAGLRALGERARFEPAARIDHANVSRLAPWLHQRYLVGRIVAANRSGRWSPIRRLAYVFGSPLIPVVLMVRRRKGVREASRWSMPPGTVPALVLGNVVKAVGEMVGYAGGAPPSLHDRLDEYEVHKLAYTSGAIATGTPADA